MVSQTRSARIGLVACILIGVAMLVYPAAAVSVGPHFELDHVLTPTELRDPVTRAETLTILKQRASDGDRRMWSLAGSAVTLVAGFGLFASRPRQSTG